MKTDDLPDASVSIVTLAGDISIASADDLISRLKTAVESAQWVKIAVADVTDIDLASLQILCSAHRTAAQMQKSLSLQPPVPDVLIKALERSGFKRRTGCSHTPRTSCICCEEENKWGI